MSLNGKISTGTFFSLLDKWSVLTLLIGGFALYSLITILILPVFSPLRKIPGPLWARFTRLWYLKRVSEWKFHDVNIDLHRKYGAIVRITPNEYSIDDPAAVKKMYGHATKFTKSPWYYASGDASGHRKDLFTERDPKVHGNLRRKVAQLYATSNLLRMEPVVSDAIDILVQRMRELAYSGDEINMQYWLQCYAFDIIGAITVGKRFGFLDEGKDQSGIFPALGAYLKYSACVGIVSEFHPLFSALVAKLDNGGFNSIITFTMNQINSRLLNTDSKDSVPGQSEDDFLSKAIKMHTDDQEAFSMAELVSTCLTNIGAGSDTTSISLSAILYYLVTNPDTLKKLREELDPQFVNGNRLSFSELQKMPYLQACIKEAMRLHPATGLPLGRIVPPGGAQIAGQYFPQGTVVGINTWVAHRNQHVYGDDADAFRPERWIQSDKEQLSRMEAYYLPFGYGARTCIGKNISLLEMTKLIPVLVTEFDFILTRPDMPLRMHNAWFVKQMTFNCRVQVRNVLR